MKLYEYILKQAEREGPVGDFARDVVTDKSFPKTASYRAVSTYLINCSACDGAMVAFEKIWEEFKHG